MTWVATGIMLLAAAGTAYNTKHTADKQDNQAAAGIREQSANQRQVNARLNSTIDQMKASDSKSAKAATGQQYLKQVQSSLAKANAGLGQRGLLAEFDQRAGGAATANADYGAVTADLMASMDAPLYQRQAEQNLMGDTGMDLSVLGSNVQGDDFLNRMKMNGIRRNGYIDFAASAMGGAARGMAGAGSSGVGGTPQYVPVAQGGRAVYGVGGPNSGMGYT